MLRPIDNLTYHSFIKKFNNKYGDILQEQKDFLIDILQVLPMMVLNYVFILNEELSRLKSALKSVGEEKTEPLITQKVKEVMRIS